MTNFEENIANQSANVTEQTPQSFKFSIAFPGYSKAYGWFTPQNVNDNGKVEGIARTIKEPIAPNLYERHLSGESSLGLVPLLDDNTVRWAALDIDDHDIDLIEFEAKVRDMGLPLIIARSKSGGCHAYLFFQDYADPTAIKPALEGMAAKLGYPGCEIFPKQMRREDDNIGNWINLPYFAGDETDRYAVHDGQKLCLDEFLSLVETSRVKSMEIGGFASEARSPAPAANKNKTPAGRNDWLFKVLVKLKQMNIGEELLRDIAHQINRQATSDVHPHFADGPLPDREVDQTVKSAAKFSDKIQDSHDDGYLMKDEALSYMNDMYAIVREGGKTLVIAIEQDDVLNRRVIVRSSIADINHFYKDRVRDGHKDNGDPKYKPLGKWWTENPMARRIKQVIFAPGIETPDKYNLWQGFMTQPKQGDWSRLRAHLLDNICCGNQEYFDYLFNWLARMIQDPAKPGETAIVFRGGRGTGKSIVGRILITIIGQHAIHVSSAHHLTGHFNAHLQDVIYIFADEAFWAGDKAGENILKTLITEKTLVIEPKGVNAFQTPNYIHLMMASNNDWIVPAGPDERRFFVLDVSDAHQQDRTYFKALMDQMEDGGYEAFLYDLMNHDLSGFDVARVPQSEALQEQKLYSLNPHQRWWLDVLMEGRLPEDAGAWSGVVSRHGLLAHYQYNLRGAGQTRKSSETQLGMQIRKLVPGIQNTTKTIFVYDQASGNKIAKPMPAYKMPSLEICRGHFEKLIRARLDWPPPHDDGTSPQSLAVSSEEDQGEIPF